MALVNSLQCDRGRPSCQRCIARDELCVGYRDEADLMFQHETEKVVLRSQTASTSASSGSSPRSRRTRSRSLDRVSERPSMEHPSAYPWLKEAKQPSEEDQAAEMFMEKYVLLPCNESSSPGFLEHLPCLFKEVNVEGRYALRWAVQACAFADLSREKGSGDLASRALECYGQALNALGHSLAEKGKAPDDYDLMTVVILDIFEQKQQLAKQMSPLPESETWLEALNDKVSSVRLEKDGLAITKICQSANQLLQSLDSRALTCDQLLDLVDEMRRLDREAARWRDRPEWAFRSITRGEVTSNKEEENDWLPEIIQLHPDIWMAYEWNYHRTARIILHQKLVACLQRASTLSSSENPLISSWMTESIETIQFLADGVLSTVPQSLGDVNHLGFCRTESTQPRWQAVGAYLLLWPIKIIKERQGLTTQSQKMEAQMVFDRIRQCTGMKMNLGALSAI
ncbi:hypothetical protein ACJ41O_009506 [Fusarium nematophilum]